jgi:hypothetical protein
MAYLEAAVVVYLRRIFGITELTNALGAFDGQISRIEIGREAATLTMLFAISMIAGINMQSRIGHFLLSFGVWDIFYYVWLKVFLNWPATFFDYDLLFLLPLPWWGPILTPLLLALIMTVTGLRLVNLDQLGIKVHFLWADWVILIAGILIVLYAFMADALAALSCETAILVQLQPTGFQWPVYSVGLFLILFPLWRAIFKKKAA